MALDPPRTRRTAGMTVEAILARLRGAARRTWLEKWARWVSELLRVYGIEDPHVIGMEDVDPENVERLIREHCHGLTESECFDRIESLVREKGATKAITEEVVDDIRDYIDYMEKVGWLPPEIRTKVQYFREHPWENHERVYSMVRDFLIKQGVEPAEAEVLATEVSLLIPRIDMKRRAEVLEAIMRRVPLARQQALDKWMKRVEKAEEQAREIKREISETEKELGIWRKPSFSDLLSRIVAELEKLGVRPTDADRLVQKHRGEIGVDYAKIRSLEDYDRTVSKWVSKILAEYEELRAAAPGTVGYEVLTDPRAVERWRRFIEGTCRTFGVTPEQVFGTKDIVEVLKKMCWALAPDRCREAITTSVSRKAEELAAAGRPPSLAAKLAVEVRRRLGAPAPAKVPEEAEEYLVDELIRLFGWEFVKAQSRSSIVAVAKLRTWCTSTGRFVEVGKPFPEGYRVRVFYFEKPPTRCYIMRRDGSVQLFGCDAPVVAIAWNSKCYISSLQQV